ncbi:hypothetical protein SISSUDRAFT_969269, partial [Sistotremastrum suecicum HHB10207 ss-3]
PGTFLISATPDTLEAYVRGYQADPSFSGKWTDPKGDPLSWYAGRRYYKDHSGLLYFRDADFLPRLCVPRSLRPALLRQYHESPMTGAHAG